MARDVHVDGIYTLAYMYIHVETRHDTYLLKKTIGPTESVSPTYVGSQGPLEFRDWTRLEWSECVGVKERKEKPGVFLSQQEDAQAWRIVGGCRSLVYR